MSIKLLLIVTAVIELATGVALLTVPSQTAELLLGAGLGSPEAAKVGQVAGAALISIGLSCWLEKNRSGLQTGLLAGLLAYNALVVVLLVFAAVAEKMHGIGLWPAVGLHSGLAIWCVVSLSRKVT